jgi:hypothetical protein
MEWKVPRRLFFKLPSAVLTPLEGGVGDRLWSTAGHDGLMTATGGPHRIETSEPIADHRGTGFEVLFAPSLYLS